MSGESEGEITGLGEQGDGVAIVGGERRHVPLSAPGDRVRLRDGVPEIVTFGQARQTPPCPHFGRCGGCRLQHLAPGTYADFKRERLRTAVARAGYDPALVGGLVAAGGSGRRRVDWAMRVEKGEVTLGFHALRSDRVVPIGPCPVSTPAIEAMIDPLRAHLATLKKPGRVRSIVATELEGGLALDVALDGMAPPRDVAAWTRFAEESRLARLSFTGAALEIVVENGAWARMAGALVRPPVGAFLQATEDGERFLAGTVARYLTGRKSVVDLYSGIGTFGLPLLAAGHRVAAFEGSQAMLEALWNAAGGTLHRDRLSIEARDLHRAPVPAGTLRRFDAAVINPPRNGAERQVRELAASEIGTIAFVSCDPATFARDAAHLRRGGYALEEAVPVDQFRWSSHLEIVARFTRIDSSPADGRNG